MDVSPRKNPKTRKRHFDLAKIQRSLSPEALWRMQTRILSVETQMPAVMYTDSARRVLGSEKATLTRCDGEAEGAETATERKMRTKKATFAYSPVNRDLRRTIIGNTPKAHTRKVTRSVVGRKGMTSNFERVRVDTPPACHVTQKVVDAHTVRDDCGRM